MRGFTLVELLVAMAIFAVLGIALVSLLVQSTAFLEKGQAGGETQDMLENAERLFEADLANIYVEPATAEGEPDTRLVCDPIGFDVDGDKIPDVVSWRLAFVRSLRGELSDRVLRDAGNTPGASGRVDGEDDIREAEDGDLRAPGGKSEVMYLLLPGRLDPETGEDNRGVGRLFRGERTPPGGKESFLPWEPWREGLKPGQHRAGIVDAKTAETRLRAVLEGVLYLEFEWFDRHTSAKGARLIVNGDPAPRNPPRAEGGGGPSPSWDSTRGILPKGTRLGQFFLGLGAASVADSTDDVYPERVRLTIVVDRVGTDAVTGELARGIGDADSVVSVDDTGFAPTNDPVARYIKIEDEWIRWSSKDGRSFTVDERGARGTKAAAHPAGSIVRAGATLVREFEIPTYRENWNE